MGNCCQTIQARGYPLHSSTVAPKYLQQRQVEQRIPSQLDLTPQIPSKPSSPVNQPGFINGLLGMRSPRMSSYRGSRKGSGSKKIVTNSRIQEALQRRVQETKDRPITFHRIILKFEKLSNVLKDVKTVFQELSKDYPDGLTLQGLQEAMASLDVEMTKDEIADLFGFIDLDGSLKIELKEFLVALTIGMMLDKIPAFQALGPLTLSPRTPHITSPVSITLQTKTIQIRDMLNLIISAYLLFDPFGEGLIRKASVERILEEVGHQAGKNAMLSGDKWKQMDWDLNGTIDFAEFVISFSAWVDINDIMEDSVRQC